MSCPSSNLLESARRNLSEVILSTFQNSPCGGIGWTQVANLNMSDPLQQCPSPWTLHTSPARSCSFISAPGCQGFTIPVPVGRYTRVCGRATGYTAGTPDEFADFGRGRNNIETFYLDGVSLTYGSPRQHIWSFAAGHGVTFRCPCDSTDRGFAPLPPSFVGDNYFCDGEYNGALWDGQDCTSDCCTFNSPPYFSATLPAPTSDDIEVRMCSDESSGEPYIALLQLYVQ